MSGRRRSRARGNALVEFVLVLPFFLMVALGAIDWGWYFVVREVVTNATRQAARVGAAAPVSSIRTDAETAARSYLQAALGPAYDRAPDVRVENCQRAAYPCVIVRYESFPVVPQRSTSSLSGLIAWTLVPPTVTVQSQMRVEP